MEYARLVGIPLALPQPSSDSSLAGASIMAINSRENTSILARQGSDPAQSMDASTPTTSPMTRSNSNLRRKPAPPADGGVLWIGPSQTQDAPSTHYAMMRSRSVRPRTVLVDENEPNPLAEGSDSTVRPPPAAVMRSPTSTMSSELTFTPAPDTSGVRESSEVDAVALAIERDRWPMPPNHFGSSTGTASSQGRPLTPQMQQLYNAAFFPQPQPPPSPELHPYARAS